MPELLSLVAVARKHCRHADCNSIQAVSAYRPDEVTQEADLPILTISECTRWHCRTFQQCNLSLVCCSCARARTALFLLYVLRLPQNDFIAVVLLAAYLLACCQKTRSPIALPQAAARAWRQCVVTVFATTMHLDPTPSADTDGCAHHDVRLVRCTRGLCSSSVLSQKQPPCMSELTPATNAAGPSLDHQSY